MDKITSSYEHELQIIYNKIAKRGLLIDVPRLQELDKKIKDEIKLKCEEISNNWNCHVYVGTSNKDGSKGEVNLNSSKGEAALIKKLKDLGFKVPLVRSKNRDTNESESKESTAELPLRRVFAETQDINISHILRVRELSKMATTYCAARLFNGVYHSSYNVASTVTGRRGSRKHIFGFGGNGQNFPKHSALGEEFRKCIIARPGYIFLSVDQISAEDWAVAALSQNTRALDELKSGVDRHTKLAAFIFGMPEAAITKDSIYRYLGKKARHASNYGMRGQRFSDVLAQEGFPIPKKSCDDILQKVANYDPSIESVFHEYIRSEISTSRLLRTPFGRERFFLGFRPNDANYELYNEAYSYIPQSTIGDNTGFAVKWLDGNTNNCIVQEAHDSIVQEVLETSESIRYAFRNARTSFERDIVFSNGFRINIPIEAELGYNFGEFIKVKPFSEQGLLEAWQKLQEQKVQNAAQTV